MWERPILPKSRERCLFRMPVENNSAVWTGDDLVVVCAKNSFTYNFAAMDPDGDQLVYSFCEAYTNSAPNNEPAGSPPYFSVPYNNNGYSADHPSRQ